MAEALRSTFIYFAALFAFSASAHEDPFGDVYPTISIEDGEFVVWFSNGVLLPEEDKSGNWTKTTRLKARVSPDGTKLLDRKEVAGPRPEQKEILFPEGKINGGLQAAAKWERGAQDMGGFSHIDDTLFFHMSPFRNGDEPQPMYLGAYSIKDERVYSWAHVGVSGRIYYFAVASRTVFADGFVYVAWIEERDRRVEKRPLQDGTTVDVAFAKHQVVLTKWKLGEPEAVHLPIRQTLGDNSSLDIAIKGNKLLVAWHEGFGGTGSRIGTAIVDVTKAKFSKKIDYSPQPSIHEARTK